MVGAPIFPKCVQISLSSPARGGSSKISSGFARISPRDGHVIAWIDLSGLLPDDQKINAESVLNGIAYDAQHDRLFVTGKQWPAVFEIKVVPLQAQRLPPRNQVKH